ncbi:MAG: hypothetical protein AAF570_28000, partial [Bacteroidota bacterium]
MNTERFDRYLSGQLSAAEVAALEAEMAANPELAEEFSVHVAAMAAIELEAEADLKAELKARGRRKLDLGEVDPHVLLAPNDANSTQTDEEETNSFPGWWNRLRPNIGIYVIAASVLLFVSIFLSMPSNETPSAQTLFAQHYERPPDPSLRAAYDDTTGFEDAISPYRNGDWLNTLQSIDRYYAKHPNADLEARFYQAIAAVEADSLHFALRNFESVYTSGHALRYRAQWYMALTYLKLNLDTARGILNT